MTRNNREKGWKKAHVDEWSEDEDVTRQQKKVFQWRRVMTIVMMKMKYQSGRMVLIVEKIIAMIREHEKKNKLVIWYENV